MTLNARAGLRGLSLVLWSLGSLLAQPALGAQARQLLSIEAVGDFTQDFSVEAGTLKVLQRRPLHIQLRVAPEGDSRSAADAMFRAFLWGAYRTFLHTDLEQVTVTVVSPTPVDGQRQMTATATKERALAVARQIPGIESWSDMITASQAWSSPMKRCLYNSYGEPGIRACALRVAGKA